VDGSRTDIQNHKLARAEHSKSPQLEEKNNMAHISYSQLSLYNECPKHWQLNYINKVSVFRPSIHLVFGSAMHTTLQTYLDTMYNSTIKNADSLDLPNILYESLGEEFLKSKAEHDKNPCTKSELKEFYVEVDFLHKPTFRTKVKAVNEAQAITRAVEVSLHPKNTMYRNDSRVITVEQRNQDIRDWRKEEAESGNI